MDEYWGDDGTDETSAGSGEGWPEESDEDRDVIDDPEALRRAEMAVAAADDEPAPWVPTDTEWLPVAAARATLGWSLEQLREVLEQEGIPAGYDPYDPHDSITLPYGLPAEFRVVVPAERLRAAMRIVAELAAEGAAWAPVRQEPLP